MSVLFELFPVKFGKGAMIESTCASLELYETFDKETPSGTVPIATIRLVIWDEEPSRYTGHIVRTIRDVKEQDCEVPPECDRMIEWAAALTASIEDSFARIEGRDLATLMPWDFVKLGLEVWKLKTPQRSEEFLPFMTRRFKKLGGR